MRNLPTCGAYVSPIKELCPWNSLDYVGLTLEAAIADVASQISNWTPWRAFLYLIEELPDRSLLGNCTVEEYGPEGAEYRKP